MGNSSARREPSENNITIKSSALRESGDPPERRIPPSDIDPSEIETNESIPEHSTSIGDLDIDDNENGELVPSIQRPINSDNESDTEKGDDGAEEEIEEQFDEYGFAVEGNYEIDLDSPERLLKWQEMTNDWDTWVRKKHTRLKERIRKGIPNAYRTVAWAKLVKSDVYKHHCNKIRKDYYKWLVTKQKPAQDALSVIQVDLDRTFPRHELFKNRKGDGQNQLYHVLYAYACHDQELGYCQGMGFLAALFLMYYTEEDAFYCLLSLLNNPKYDMRGLFLENFPLLNERFFQFDELLKQHFPKLQKHLADFDVTPQFYALPWFMSVFLYHNVNFSITARIWDAYLSEGYKVVFRIGLAIMKEKRSEILKLKNLESLVKTMQKAQSDIPPDVMKKAFAISLSRKDLKKASIKYKQQQRQTPGR